MSDTEVRRRGRPRSENTRRAILDAAFELGASEDLAEFTIGGIAARAGVSKQTVYKWWPTKADVLMEALAHQADLFISIDDHSSYEQDLAAFLSDTFEILKRPGMTNALRSLMAESQQDREFKERFWTGFLERRRTALGHIVHRAEERGDLPDVIRGELIGDVVFGVIWYRMLATARPLTDQDAEGLAALLTGETRSGISPH